MELKDLGFDLDNIFVYGTKCLCNISKALNNDIWKEAFQASAGLARCNETSSTGVRNIPLMYNPEIKQGKNAFKKDSIPCMVGCKTIRDLIGPNRVGNLRSIELVAPHSSPVDDLRYLILSKSIKRYLEKSGPEWPNLETGPRPSH